MLAGLREEKEPNPSKSFRPWECDDSLHTHCTRATVSQYKKVIKRLTGRNLILTTEIAVKTLIHLVKRRRGTTQEVSMTVPESGMGSTGSNQPHLLRGGGISPPSIRLCLGRQHYRMGLTLQEHGISD